MLVKNCIYCTVILLSLFSIISLGYSIKNKDKYICKKIIMIDILYIVYLIVNFCLLAILCIPVGLEMLFLYLLAFVAGILYIISIILNLIKTKKIKKYDKQKKVTITTIILMILPVLFLLSSVLRNECLISHSDLILVYHSSGNGGIGDSDTFAYAIGENFCKQFDLGIDLDGYYLKNFLPKNVIEITDINNIVDYKITLEDDVIWVYKNNKYICKKNIKSHYFNINFERGFYVNGK